MSRKFDINKLINAILFFSSQGMIGITKLNKLLYYSDFEHYRLYGRPIIGDEYIKMPQGPVPERTYSIFNSNFRDNFDDTLKQYIDVKHRTIFSFTEKTIVAKQDPNLDYFSQSEIEIMKMVCDIYMNQTARGLSEQSHEENPWRLTEPFKKIYYKLILDRVDDTSIPKEYADYREQKDEELDSLLS